MIEVLVKSTGFEYEILSHNTINRMNLYYKNPQIFLSSCEAKRQSDLLGYDELRRSLRRSFFTLQGHQIIVTIHRQINVIMQF